jgi:hypothetical protein
LVVGGGRSESEKRGALASSITAVTERGRADVGAVQLLVVFVLLLRFDWEAKREEGEEEEEAEVAIACCHD